MEPATTIVKMLGGQQVVAKLLELTPSAVSRWGLSKGKGGANGIIPSAWIPELCREARRQNLFLEPNMFFAGHL